MSQSKFFASCSSSEADRIADLAKTRSLPVAHLMRSFILRGLAEEEMRDATPVVTAAAHYGDTARAASTQADAHDRLSEGASFGVSALHQEVARAYRALAIALQHLAAKVAK